MFNPRYQNTQYYLQKQRKNMDLNLMVRDIPGTIPMNHYDKLNHKMEITRINQTEPISLPKENQISFEQKNRNLHQKIYNDPPQNIRNEIKKNYSADILLRKNPEGNYHPEYKCVGKNEKKQFIHKEDGRFNVKDINDKKRRIWPWEKNIKEQILKNNRNENFDKLQLPKLKINKSVEYILSNKKIESVKNADTDLYRNNVDKFKNNLKHEAYVKFQKEKIFRQEIKAQDSYNRRLPTHDNNSIKEVKRGYKK
jgi:hypothetical protein